METEVKSCLTLGRSIPMTPKDHGSTNLILNSTVNVGPTSSHNFVTNSLRVTQGFRPALTNMVAASHSRCLIINFN